MIKQLARGIMINTVISVATHHAVSRLNSLGEKVMSEVKTLNFFKASVNAKWEKESKNIDSALYSQVFEILNQNTDLTRRFFMTEKHDSKPIYLALETTVLKAAEEFASKL